MDTFGGDTVKYDCKCGQPMLMKELNCPVCRSANYPISGDNGLIQQLSKKQDAEKAALRKRVEELEGILGRIINEHPHPSTGGNAPSHMHHTTGKWDSGGEDCEWCKVWNEAKNALTPPATEAEAEENKPRFSTVEAANGSDTIKPGSILRDTKTGEIVGIALTASDAYEIRTRYAELKATEAEAPE